MSRPAHQRLFVVTGKGGVGKSAVSAALALGFAGAGERTLVCEVNTTERVTALLGHRPVGPEIRQIEDNLWAVDVRPHEALREYALKILRFQMVYRAVFENRVVRYFIRFVPSVPELVMLGKILFHLKETEPDGRPRFDRVVIDAPATGHAITFLQAPEVIVQTVPPGPMRTEATWMHELVVSPHVTRTVLVSLPEEMPVNETVELGETLRARLNVPVQTVLLNAFISERFSDEELRALDGNAALPMAKAHRVRSDLSARAKKTLERGLGLPVHTLPRLYAPVFGRPAIEALLPLVVSAVGERA